jgi:hypothetical protein
MLVRLGPTRNPAQRPVLRVRMDQFPPRGHRNVNHAKLVAHRMLLEPRALRQRPGKSVDGGR